MHGSLGELCSDPVPLFSGTLVIIHTIDVTANFCSPSITDNGRFVSLCPTAVPTSAAPTPPTRAPTVAAASSSGGGGGGGGGGAAAGAVVAVLIIVAVIGVSVCVVCVNVRLFECWKSLPDLPPHWSALV